MSAFAVDDDSPCLDCQGKRLLNPEKYGKLLQCLYGCEYISRLNNQVQPLVIGESHLGSRLMEEAFKIIQAFSNPNRWQKIILHHSATVDGKTNDWDAIRNWHTGKTGSPNHHSPNYNPYIDHPDRDIGYHFGIENTGGKYLYRIGRNLDWDGAHTLGQNRVAIGICVIGCFDKVKPNDVQYHLLASICRELMRKFNIPASEIHKHSEFAPKTCPGSKFDLAYFRTLIAAIG